MEELAEIDIKEAMNSEKGFKKLYDHYSPFVWRVAFRTANGNSEVASAIVQSVFIAVNKNIKKFSFKSAFSSWLYKISWRETINLVNRERKERKRVTQLSGFEKSKEEFHFSEEELENILSYLNPDERFLLVSRELDGFSFSELSEITGKKEGALRVMLNRIKQKLREELGDER